MAASNVLMIRFRKRWPANINIAITNRITSLFAGWLPGGRLYVASTGYCTRSPEISRVENAAISKSNSSALSRPHVASMAVSIVPVSASRPSLRLGWRLLISSPTSIAKRRSLSGRSSIIVTVLGWTFAVKAPGCFRRIEPTALHVFYCVFYVLQKNRCQICLSKFSPPCGLRALGSGIGKLTTRHLRLLHWTPCVLQVLLLIWEGRLANAATCLPPTSSLRPFDLAQSPIRARG
jgi:hypothetical protein